MAYPQPPFNPNAPVGYPPQAPGYPPQAPGYPPQAPGYPPQAPGYPQPSPGYPQPSGYPQAGYPPAGLVQPAVVNQPQVGFAPSPAPVVNGLQYLAQLDQVLVHQEVELLEAFTGFETANRYTVKNSLGQPVFYAVEDTGCCNRNCCGPSRPFDMRLMDHSQREVIHLSRPLRCQSCWFPCCLQELDVEGPGGHVLGSVRQRWSLLRPSFSVHDASGKRVLDIVGPVCTCSMCGDVEFELVSVANDQRVGCISKQWSGLAKEAFTDADNFGVSFPIDLDPNLKATVLGATFLIDFMFFEKRSNKETDNPGMF